MFKVTQKLRQPHYHATQNNLRAQLALQFNGPTEPLHLSSPKLQKIMMVENVCHTRMNLNTSDCIIVN